MNHVETLVSKDPADAKSTDGETRAKENQAVVWHGENSKVALNADEEARWDRAAKEVMARRVRLLSRR